MIGNGRLKTAIVIKIKANKVATATKPPPKSGFFHKNSEVKRL